MTIKFKPNRTVAIKTGQPVELSVVATSDPCCPHQFAWQLNGTNLTETQLQQPPFSYSVYGESARLRIDANTTDDVLKALGTYRCIVYHRVYEDPLMVDVIVYLSPEPVQQAAIHLWWLGIVFVILILIIVGVVIFLMVHYNFPRQAYFRKDYLSLALPPFIPYYFFEKHRTTRWFTNDQSITVIDKVIKRELWWLIFLLLLSIQDDNAVVCSRSSGPLRARRSAWDPNVTLDDPSLLHLWEPPHVTTPRTRTVIYAKKDSPVPLTCIATGFPAPTPCRKEPENIIQGFVPVCEPAMVWPYGEALEEQALAERSEADLIVFLRISESCVRSDTA
ncbi:hypothetical protein C0Q70_07692 [Pomacea canaliculata]|uniref:Ig-like domain-containing protein n=1 Tax=Pomacea canaliculata TaxID=400727 RepID=A0A2T7PFT2_POMCA|nr:hypothetical protein C0Q70_07692 [Pomacea canaliculata]